MCVTEGTLRAHLDNELTAREVLTVKSHLSTCPDCRHLAEAILARSKRVEVLISSLESAGGEQPVNAHRAYALFKAKLKTAESAEVPLLERLFGIGRKAVPAGVFCALLVVAVLAGLSQSFGEGVTSSRFIEALDVFHHLTLRAAGAALTALLISLAFGGLVIGWLRRLQFGWQLRVRGPGAHPAHRRTPMMGGVLIVGSVAVSTLLWARPSNLYVRLALMTTLLFATVGLFDDYSRIAKPRGLGLTARQKLLAQSLIAAGFWAALYFLTDYSWDSIFHFFTAAGDPNPINGVGRMAPYQYLLPIALLLVFMSNAVSMTDGSDGLAVGVALVATAALTAITCVTGDHHLAAFFGLPHRPELAELAVFCGALTGACLGFLMFNAPPAEVYMGDVGSHAVGGALGAVGVLAKQEFILLIVCGVFVIEVLSVVTQVSFFKMTRGWTGDGRRLFKMAPLHHHFELSGWSESKVLCCFLLLAVLFALLGLSALKLW